MKHLDGAMKLLRVKETLCECEAKYPDDNYLEGWREKIDLPEFHKHWLYIEKDLQILDSANWLQLREKAVSRFKNYRKGQDKQDFINLLNEAKGFRHLKDIGCIDVCFIEETSKSKSPDVKGLLNNETIYCEVKTIGISNDEIDFRKDNENLNTDYTQLKESFFDKLKSTICTAASQIDAMPQNLSIHYIYVIITFDDFTGRHLDNYQKQIDSFVCNHPLKNKKVIIDNFQ